jgi:hypothetical protein
LGLHISTVRTISLIITFLELELVSSNVYLKLRQPNCTKRLEKFPVVLQLSVVVLIFSIFCLFVSVVLGFKLRAAFTLSHSASPFLWWVFSRGSQELFAWAGFKPWSSSSPCGARIIGVRHQFLASSFQLI